MDTKTRSLRVGFSPIPPFIDLEYGKYVGFEADLLAVISARTEIEFTYHEILKFAEVLPSLTSKKIDIAVGAITVGGVWERQYDFSHSYLEAGLAIAQSRSHQKAGIPFRVIFSKRVLWLLGILITAIVVVGHAVWFFERGGGGNLDAPYFPGVFNSMWWALITAATIGYGDYSPVTMGGRIMAALFIILGLGVFGTYLAEMSSAFVIERNRSNVRTHHDLKGRRVAVIVGTPEIEIVSSLGATAVPIHTSVEALAQLKAGEVEAFVTLAPMLRHLEERDRDLIVSDAAFGAQLYAFAFRTKDPMIETINRALVDMYESGEYDAIYRKWFDDTDLKEHRLKFAANAAGDTRE